MRTLGKIQITLLAFVIMVAIPFSAYAVDGKIQIGQTVSTTFPIVIDQPGSYVLTSNLTVITPGISCIYIEADNVTLDLNGFALIGPGTGEGGGNGISVHDRRNVTINNGTIRNFLASGVYFWPDDLQPHNYQVRNIRAYSNGTGIYAPASTIVNCVSAQNLGNGIQGRECIIKDCMANNNNGSGIEVEVSLVSNCVANFNGQNGITGSSLTVTNCTAFHNNQAGFQVTGSTITNCTAHFNDSDGFKVDRSTITHCTATSNNTGISPTGSHIDGNNVRDNNVYGINAYNASENNYIIKNTGSGSGTSNFRNGGTNNYMPICGVDVTDNCNYSF